MRRLATAGVALAVCLLVHVAPAVAQGDAPAAARLPSAQAPAQGPLVLEPIRGGFVISPEVRVTRVDGANRAQVGGYGAWLMDNSFLLGGGGYWLADRRAGHTEMYYGGVVAGWSLQANRWVHVGVRALVGYGQARWPVFEAQVFPDQRGWDWGRDPHDMDMDPRDVHQPRVSRTFVVAEPQASVSVRLGHWIWLDAGAGYRGIGNAGGAEQRLRGAFGAFGVRIGPQG